MSDKSKITFSIVTVLAGIVSIIESGFLIGAVAVYIPILLIIAAVFLSLISIYAINKRRDVLFKFSLILLLIEAGGAGIYLALVKTGALALLNDADSLTALIKKSGIWGPMVFVLIQFLQVTFVPIPSTITTIAGLAVFDNIWLVMLCSSIGMILGSLFAFFLGRVFGVKLVVWMVGSKGFNKYQKILKGRETMMLFLMFILPLFPDDLLCLFAGVTTMSYPTFIILQIFSRPIQIIGTSWTAELLKLIPFTKWWGILLWIVIGALLIALMVCVWKYSNKMQAWMVRVMSKHFGTNEMTATINKKAMQADVPNLISDTIVDSDSDSTISVVNSRVKHKAKRYHIDYKD